VYWDPFPVIGAQSTLTRHSSGASINFTTNSLAAGHAVTLWWFVFNHPENCTHGTVLGHCGPGDLAADRSVDPSLVYGTGLRVGLLGLASFDTSLSMNDATRAAFGPGLTNPLGAEIHVGLRDDGPAGIPADFGDCHPDCVFVQFSAFPA
jgi:hypothetical protein